MMSVAASVLQADKQKKAGGTPPDLSSYSSIELLGDETSARQAGQIWSKYAPGTSLHYTPAKGALMATPLQKSENRAWVLCVGPEFNYDAAILFLQRHAPVSHVYWHYLNFDSMISSSDKKGLGEVLVG